MIFTMQPGFYPGLSWCCDNAAAALHTKPLIQHLDLSGCFVTSASAAAGLCSCFKTTVSLHTLVYNGQCNQPDAMLNALLNGIESLPSLSCLDLRGLFTERTLAGARLLQRRDRQGRGALELARHLPVLKSLAVGFELLTALGHRDGSNFLASQAVKAPNLSLISCSRSFQASQVDGRQNPPLSIAATDLVAVDIACRLCHSVLYEGLISYLLHPPQQGHISYELHTDVPPIEEAVSAVGGDETRLQCRRGCHGALWLIDGGSGQG